MRWCGLCVVLVFLMAEAASNTIAKEELAVGDEIPFIIQTVPYDVDGCFIKTPQNKIIEFKPNDGSLEKKFELLADNLLTSCQVKVTITGKEDQGVWSIYFTENNTVVNTMEYDITVKSSGATDINYIVTKGSVVEISVRKNEDVVGCTLTTPEDAYITPNDAEHPGIAFIQTDLDPFTSCRVQIGPVNDDSLIGDWILCSQRLVDNSLSQECQSASITWNNGNRDSYWNNKTQSKFDHPVHFDSHLTVYVQNSGTIKSCHMVTPTGNDLTVTQTSNFPYVKRSAPYDGCTVTIGPIDAGLLGEWVLYGIYTGFDGVTEVRLPMSLFLYDTQNPYEQAYNVTKPDPIVKIVNILNTIELEVSGKGDVDKCEIIPPENADIENDVVSIDGSGTCRYSVGPITENMLGDWLVSAKFSNNKIHTEIRQVFVIKKEDPHNPEIDTNRYVRDLEPIRFETVLGAKHEVMITGDQSFRIIESCHVRTPDGLQYSVIDGFHIPGIDASKGTNCELIINVISEDIIGDWSLIARKLDYGLPVEERLNFTIYVEEQVEAIPSQVTIYESKDLVIRLREKTRVFESCKLYGPEGEYLNYEINTEFYEYCGFIVRNVDETMNGIWQIVYEDGLVYRASVAVNVISANTVEFPNMTWVIDQKIDSFYGPDDVSYCQVKDPNGDIVFDSFGRCKIAVSRVGSKHDGVWTATIGHQGKIQMENFSFKVAVARPLVNRPTVIPQVQTQSAPLTVSLMCSVDTEHEVQLCKFRDPRGEVLIASEGVAQGRYMAFGSGSVFKSDVQMYHHECGLRISSVAAADTGIWRCAIVTTNDTYYGFLPVRGEATTTTNTLEPKLSPNKKEVTAIVGDDITMSCSIPTRIRYCYFRHEDGTVYNLVPGVSSEISYFGAGLDAGECGLRFSARSVRDSGRWGCSVGLDDVIPERRETIHLNVYDELTLEHFTSQGALVVRATVMKHRDTDVPVVEHCRFVRSDGFVVLTWSRSAGYSTSVINNACSLKTARPVIADYRPWTVTVKVSGRVADLTAVTNYTMPYGYYGWSNSIFWLWLSITMVGFSMILLGCSLGPKKNRDWTFERARSIQSSIRSSLRKPPASTVASDTDDKPPAYSA